MKISEENRGFLKLLLGIFGGLFLVLGIPIFLASKGIIKQNPPKETKKNKYTNDYIQGYRDGWNSRAKVLVEELVSSVMTHRK